METRKMKLALSAGAIALSMALVGCGGGGSSTAGIGDDPGDDDDTPTVVTEQSCAAQGVGFADGACTDVCIDGYENFANGRCMMAETPSETTEVATARAMGLFDALTDSPQVGKKVLGVNSTVSIDRGQSGTPNFSINDGESGWVAGDTPSSISGWTSTKLNRDKESYVIYSNIDAAKRKAFLTAYKPDTDDEGATAPTGINGVTINFQGTPDPTNHGLVTFNNAGIKAAGEAGLLDPSKFPQPKAAGEGENKFEYSNVDGKKDPSFPGTFHGASGTWTCTSLSSQACTVTVTAPNTEGGPVYTAGDSDTWTFKPAAGNAALIVEQDNDHMHFGWWVETPTKAGSGGEFLYDVYAFHGGTQFPVTGTVRADLVGKATYEGSAAGLYAVKAHMDEGTAVSAARGEFTADVSLTVDFKVAGTIGDVSGKIEDFVREDGVANEWNLTLEKQAIVADGPSTGRVVADGTNVGGWQYNLYGTGKDDADPTGIAGKFNAKIGDNTAVAGGFGATRATSSTP